MLIFAIRSVFKRSSVKIYNLIAYVTATIFVFRSVGLIAPGKTGSNRRLFVTRALQDPRSVMRWMNFVQRYASDSELTSVQSQLYEKPVRAYIVHGLTVSERVDLLIGHYNEMSRIFSNVVIAAVWYDRSLELGRLTGRNGTNYKIMIGNVMTYYREGEIGIYFIHSEKNAILARITFIIVREGGVSTVCIGGLQGPKPSLGGKADIVSATRDLSGLRPKMVVFLAVSALSECLGSHRLKAVSNRTHIKNSSPSIQRRRMLSDYDEFWQERGGVPADIGFAMPVRQEPRAVRRRQDVHRLEISNSVKSFFYSNQADSETKPRSSQFDFGQVAVGVVRVDEASAGAGAWSLPG